MFIYEFLMLLLLVLQPWLILLSCSAVSTHIITHLVAVSPFSHVRMSDGISKSVRLASFFFGISGVFSVVKYFSLCISLILGFISCSFSFTFLDCVFLPFWLLPFWISTAWKLIACFKIYLTLPLHVCILVIHSIFSLHVLQITTVKLNATTVSWTRGLISDT